MNKYKNYIYYSICEKSFELFQDSNYLTYSSFCYGIKAAIQTKEFDWVDSSRVYEIIVYIKKLYGLKPEEYGEYINEYFLDEKFLVFEKPIRIINEFFKNSLN